MTSPSDHCYISDFYTGICAEGQLQAAGSGKYGLRVIEIAKSGNLPVELAGSTLGHVYYQLEKSGVSVILADETRRPRVRHRQNFDKLVRDKIPQRIES